MKHYLFTVTFLHSGLPVPITSHHVFTHVKDKITFETMQYSAASIYQDTAECKFTYDFQEITLEQAQILPDVIKGNNVSTIVSSL